MIAAVGKNLEIGKDNKLLWYLPNDLPFFKKITNGKKIIMGRLTFESLPKVLPNRTHLVLTKNKIKNDEILQFSNINDLMMYINKLKDEEVFIIGGGSVYKQFIDYADSLYITEVDKTYYNADTFFPEFNKEEFNKTIIDEYKDDLVSYQHVLYERKRKKNEG
ncbi:MAG TPA: dihydrofolate reductase [Tenericutes bacterium]|nr:dihydrofolate reductase [Mycoplasmatota bacterium]